METIMKTVLLLAVLCLAGCKSEEAPYLEVSADKTEVGCTGETLTVTVSSNGSWRTVLDKGNTYIGSMEGEGPGTVTFELPSNKTYDDVTYTLNTQSTDGSMSDTKTILQKASIGLEVKGISQIPEGGATVDIPVKTNDNITSVETPDWITFTSSRALTSYTYTFKAEPNKTGAVRKGTVRFKGNATEKSVEVTQDSYAPTGVDLSAIPDLLASSFVLEEAKYEDVSIPVKVIPEYADPSKLTVSIKPSYKANYTFKNGTILLKHTNQGPFGEYTITFYSKNKEIAVKKTTIVDGNITFSYYGGRTNLFYVGETFSFHPTIEENIIETSVSDEQGISILSPTSFRAEKEGTYKITFTHKVSGKQVTRKISVEKTIAIAYLSYKFDWGSLWDVELVGEFYGADITEYTTAFINGNQSLQVPLNKRTGTSPGTDYVTNKYRFNITAYNLNDLEYKIKKFKFVFEGIVNGQKCSRTSPVSLEKP